MINRIGQLLGNYRLTLLLGQGGFADVYLGEHIYLNTQVAIKVLRTHMTGGNVTSFHKEARTIAHLEHPHIVPVLDFGLDGPTPFLVMAYAPGGTLRQRYPRGSRLPAEQVVLYVKQLASALQYAHQQKLIHRDIKPENILLGRTHEVLLSDFGIARVTPSARARSLLEYGCASDMGGTVFYMAPEQIKGKPVPASDQYALGVVAFEWLCGKLPFNGAYMEVAMQHISAEPPSLREQNPTIPADVEQVVMTALAKNPAQRFASVQAFATALEQAYQQGPFIEQPSTSSVKLTRRAQLPASLAGSFGNMELGASAVKIGRNPSNQLVIDDVLVSSQHAEICPGVHGHRIVDLNSTNGTFVNDQWLPSGASRLLRYGDSISVGETKLNYVQGNALMEMLDDDATLRADSHAYGSRTPALTPVGARAGRR